MSELFKEIELEWRGTKATVAACDVLKLIACIENHITYFEVIKTDRPQFAKISAAFCAALKFAGIKNVTPEEIYSDIFKGRSEAAQALMMILAIMIPPEIMQGDQAAGGEIDTEKKQMGSL
jgi:hypothetical protein